ncbi:MAG: hypothetical protein IT494_00370 [Gammaproteobacteria bacterium]|nr:hypothetical protein [Gammaproteobacteria bacterium]
MTQEHLRYMQHSESVVAHMSATLLAAFISKGALSDADEDELVEKAIGLACKLAERAEKLVKSDQEWMKKDGESPYLVG